MAQTVDEIAEILNSMKIQNENNAEGVDKVLAGINSKLELIASDSEATDLIKVYLSELQKAMEDRHNLASAKFNEILISFKSLTDAQSDFATSSTISDLFQILTSNVNEFSGEISSQKSVLSDLSSKIQSLDKNALDKDELAGFVSSIKADFQNLNHGLDVSIANINASLQSVVKNILSLDLTEYNEVIKAELENLIIGSNAVLTALEINNKKNNDILNIVNNLVSSSEFEKSAKKIDDFYVVLSSLKDVVMELDENSSNMFNEQFSKLEKEFSNIVTDSDFAGFKKDLADFVQKIIDNSTALNSELNYSTERIESILTTVKALDFRDDFEGIVLRINDLKEVFEDGAKVNYDNLSKEISLINQAINSGVDSLDEGRQEAFKTLRNDIESVLSNIKSLNENNSGESIDTLIHVSSQISENVSHLKSQIENNQPVNQVYLNESIKFVLEELEGLKEKLFKDNEDIKGGSDIQFKNIENSISDLIDGLSDVKTELSLNTQFEPSIILDELNSTYKNVSELINNIEENTNSNYYEIKDSFENLSSRIVELKNEFNNLISNNSKKIITNLADVSDRIEQFQSEFKEVSSSSFENASKILTHIDEVSLKMDGIQVDIAGLSDDSSAEILLSIEDISLKTAQIHEDLKTLSSDNSEEISKNVSDLAEKISQIQENLKNISKENKSEILGVVENVTYKINDIQDILRNQPQDNSAEIIISVEDISIKMSQLQNELNKVSAENLEKIKEVITSITIDLENNKNSILSSSEASFEEKSAILNIISNNINNLNNALGDEAVVFKALMEEKSSALRNYISEVGNSLYESQSSGDSKLNEKLATLEDLSHGFEASLMNVNESLQSIIKDLMTMDATEQNDIIKRELENIFLSSNAILSSMKISDQKNDELVKLISTLVSKENYDDAQKRVDEIIEKTGEISAQISQLPSKDDWSAVNERLHDFSTILLSLKNIVTTSSDTNSEMIGEQFVKFESAFARIITEEDFNQFRGELTEFIQRLLDNSSILNYDSSENKIRIEQILSKLDNINYKNDFEQISQRLDDIREIFSSNSKINYENLSSELSSLSEHLGRNLSEIDNERKEAYSYLKSDLENLTAMVQHLSDTAPQKSLEALSGIAKELQMNLGGIQDSLNKNVQLNFETLSASVSNIILEMQEVKEDFGQKSDMNTFNISNGFDTFKVSMDGFISAFENLKIDLAQNGQTSIDGISAVFHDIYDKTVALIDSVEEKTIESNGQVKNDIEKLSSNIAELESKFSSMSSFNASAIISNVENVSRKVDEFQGEFSSVSSENADKIIINVQDVSSRVENLREKFEQTAVENSDKILYNVDGISIKVDSLKGEFRDMTLENSDNIISGINNVSDKVDFLKEELGKTSAENTNKIFDSVETASSKIDYLQNNLGMEIANNLGSLKDMFSNLSDELQTVQNEQFLQSSKDREVQSDDIKIISYDVKNIGLDLTTKAEDYKSHVNEVVNALREYISELNLAAKGTKSLSDSKFAEKLLSIEAAIAHNVDDYDEKLIVLQNKLSDYIKAVEESSSEADSKLTTSLAEVGEIKNELVNIQDIIKESDDGMNGKLSEVLSRVEVGVQDIVSNISDINASVRAGMNISLEESLTSVDGKFENILAVFEVLKEDNNLKSHDLAVVLEEKINTLKQEIGLVTTDISEVYNSKSEEIIRCFEPIRNDIDKLLDFDFANVLGDLRAQIDLSYVNMSSDLSVGFTQNQEAIFRLEDVYTETLNKIQTIEECLNEQTQNNLELIRLALENVNKNVNMNLTKSSRFAESWKEEVDEIKEKISSVGENYSNSLEMISGDIMTAIDEKLESYLEGLRAHIGVTLNTDDTMLAIDSLKEELVGKFNSILIEQSSRAEKADLISANIASLGDTLKDSVESACENSLDRINKTVKEITAMGSLINDNDEIVGVIENIRQELSEEISLRLNKFITVQADLDKVTTNKMSNLFSVFDEKLEKIKHDVNSFIYSAETKEEKSQILEEIYAIRNSDFGKGHEITPEILNIIDHLENKIRSLDSKNPHDEYINRIMENNKSQLLSELQNVKDETENYLKVSSDSLNTLHQKIDMLVLAEDEIVDFSDVLETINEKIDIIASDVAIDDIQDRLDDLAITEDKIAETLLALHEKVDIIAADEAMYDIQSRFEDLAITEDKISETLLALHKKVDALALFDESDDFDMAEEIEDIKSLICEQKQYFENSFGNEREAAVDNCLQDLLNKINKIENGISEVDFEKNSKDIKESIVEAMVATFEQVSFVEETEEIKGFVEEKTDEINKQLSEVQNQLKQIATNTDNGDYPYTLQDVESDIAKLRLALSDVSNSSSKDQIDDLSDNINRIVDSVEGLQSTLTQEQIFDLKDDFEKLNEDILSISSRTNKLLLTSDESYKALSGGLDKFSSVICQLEERVSYLDNTEINDRIERKVENINSLLTKSINSDKVFQQVLMYLGEWIDTTSENIASISEKTSEIDDVKNTLSVLKEAMPDKAGILEELESRFENQETRIDRLEMKIERILSAIEEKDDTVLNRKVDKIDKQLSKLSINIEKLASYVDEE